jgi:hypothetical protein
MRPLARRTLARIDDLGKLVRADENNAWNFASHLGYCVECVRTLVSTVKDIISSLRSAPQKRRIESTPAQFPDLACKIECGLVISEQLTFASACRAVSMRDNHVAKRAHGLILLAIVASVQAHATFMRFDDLRGDFRHEGRRRPLREALGTQRSSSAALRRSRGVSD